MNLGGIHIYSLVLILWTDSVLMLIRCYSMSPKKFMFINYYLQVPLHFDTKLFTGSCIKHSYCYLDCETDLINTSPLLKTEWKGASYFYPHFNFISSWQGKRRKRQTPSYECQWETDSPSLLGSLPVNTHLAWRWSWINKSWKRILLLHTKPETTNPDLRCGKESSLLHVFLWTLWA